MIVVWFSCGAASAIAAKLTLEKYGKENVRVVNSPVKEEHPDNIRFLHDIEKWLDIEVEFAVNPRFPNNSAVEVWEGRKFMSGPLGAPCTIELKKEARRLWEIANKPDYHVLGFTVDERKRFERFILTERTNVLPILIDAGLSKKDCLKMLLDASIEPSAMYKLGYPNANCIGCVKATSPTYWNHVRKTFPEVFNHRAEQSRRIGARLVRYKRHRIFLDELPVDAKGKDMNVNFDCGIFCEEKDK